jgi:energy-coupling factor transporter ATP-binding protein EcfA2
MRLLSDLNAQGMTVVLVTHEADIAAWARRKIVFKDGHIIEDVLRAEAASSAAGPPQGAKAPLGGSAAHAVASVGAMPA